MIRLLRSNGAITKPVYPILLSKDSPKTEADDLSNQNSLHPHGTLGGYCDHRGFGGVDRAGGEQGAASGLHHSVCLK